jgi:hypothetical protein
MPPAQLTSLEAPKWLFIVACILMIMWFRGSLAALLSIQRTAAWFPARVHDETPGSFANRYTVNYRSSAL